MLIQNTSGFLYNNKKEFKTFEQALFGVRKSFAGDIDTSKFLTTFFTTFFKLQINQFVH